MSVTPIRDGSTGCHLVQLPENEHWHVSLPYHAGCCWNRGIVRVQQPSKQASRPLPGSQPQAEPGHPGKEDPTALLLMC